jgi:hypothetical protein
MTSLRKWVPAMLTGATLFATTIRCDSSNIRFVPGFDRVVVVEDYYYDDGCCDDSFFGLDFFWDFFD